MVDRSGLTVRHVLLGRVTMIASKTDQDSEAETTNNFKAEANDLNQANAERGIARGVENQTEVVTPVHRDGDAAMLRNNRAQQIDHAVQNDANLIQRQSTSDVSVAQKLVNAILTALQLGRTANHNVDEIKVVHANAETGQSELVRLRAENSREKHPRRLPNSGHGEAKRCSGGSASRVQTQFGNSQPVEWIGQVVTDRTPSNAK